MFTPLFHVATPASHRHDLRTIQREMDALLSQWVRPRRRPGGPAFDVFDDGESYRLVADVPGLSADDLTLEVTEDGLSVRAERSVPVPEGYTARHRERRRSPLTRSFTFATKLDPDNVEAALSQGVLTITLAKRPQARPRSITVRNLVA